MGLHCSHYYGRGKENTRFDPDNCIALCYPCHRLWGHGDEKPLYTAFMKKKLGAAKFRALTRRSNMYKKKDRKLALIEVRKLYGNPNEKS